MLAAYFVDLKNRLIGDNEGENKEENKVENNEEDNVENEEENNVENDKVDIKKEEIKLLNQGTYGCVFRPGLMCSSKKKNSKYVIKIQNEKETSKREVEIGKKILKIKGYERYYSPVMDNCDIKLEELGNEGEVRRCNFLKQMTDKDMKYESNIIRYVGEKTIGQYLQDEGLKISQREKYYNKIVNSYVLLLNGLHKLNKNNIIHFDLKDTNILHDKELSRPIIIDYGLSIDKEGIEDKEFDWEENFLIYSTEYGPWCLDIVLISYIVNNKKEDEDIYKMKITKKSLLKVLDEYVMRNSSIKMLSESESKELKKNSEEYILEVIKGDDINSKELLLKLVENIDSWDSYSLSLTYLYILKSLKLENNEEIDYMKKFKKELKSIIISKPSERKKSNEIKENLLKELSSIEMKEKRQLINVLEEELKDEDKKKERIKEYSNYKLNTLDEIKKLKKM